ncbi:hypothetical protein NW754_001763 [Fusarium falciforme]|nr:hypothetical protein NW754_001763 [Fusarium falciforme]
MSKDEAGTSSQKGKEKGPEKTEKRREKTAQTALPAKELETDYLLALVDILRDPPFSQTHKDVRIDGPPKHNPRLSEILRNLEATTVQFYKGEGEKDENIKKEEEEKSDKGNKEARKEEEKKEEEKKEEEKKEEEKKEEEKKEEEKKEEKSLAKRRMR